MKVYLINIIKVINILFLTIVIFTTAYQFVDIPPYIMNIHRYFFIVYLIVFIALCNQRLIRVSPFFLVFLYLITVVINQRLAVISVDTQYSQRLYRLDIDSDLITEYIIILLFYLGLTGGTIFFLGVKIKKYFSEQWFNFEEYRVLRFNILSILFVLTAIWDVYNISNGGFLGGQTDVQNGFLQRYVLTIFQPDLFFYLALTFFYTASDVFRKKRFLSILIVISLFMIWKLFSGSKDGLFMLSIYYFTIYAIFSNDRKIKITIGHMIAGLVLIAIAMVSFLYVDIIRVVFWAGGDLSDVTDISSRLEKSDLIRGTIGRLSNRLSIFDESFFSLYLTDLGYHSIDHLVNFGTTLALVIDVIIPSTIFPGLIKPQYALAIAIDQDTFVNAAGFEVMTGFVWGFVGFFGYLFGKLLGAFFSILWISGGILYFIFLCRYVFPKTLSVYFLVYHIPVWLYLVLASMGLEHSASWFVHIPIINIINYLLYAFLFSIILQIKDARSS
mgnify:CR=1 FL=1